MATTKTTRKNTKASAKKASAKKVRKTTTKKAKAKKAPAKKAERNSVDESRSIKAFVGQEHHFYKGFPRGEAYQILLSQKGNKMVVKDFLDAIEKLPKVKSRAQARGIVQKLVGKPNEAASKHRVCTFC